MFDLNSSIENWKAKLIASGIYSNEDLDELEAHLKDEMDNLIEKNSLGEEDAFILAKHKIGEVKELKTEYKKVNNVLLWKKRVLLLIGGYLFIKSLVSIHSLLLVFLFSGKKGLEILNVSYPIILFIAFTILIALSFSNYLQQKIVKFLEILNDKRRFAYYLGFLPAVFTLCIFLPIMINYFVGQGLEKLWINTALYLNVITWSGTCIFYSILYYTTCRKKKTVAKVRIAKN